MPLHELRDIPLSDLVIYQRYTSRRMFPSRRFELLLAQVSMVLAQVNGSKEARLAQFLFDPPEQPDDEGAPPDPDAVAAAMNFRPRKRPPRTDLNGDGTDGQQPG
jgi:hypothetical protein